jgi:hypothetical protein
MESAPGGLIRKAARKILLRSWQIYDVIMVYDQ